MAIAIFGASSGIGRACVKSLLEKGGEQIFVISRSSCPEEFKNYQTVQWYKYSENALKSPAEFAERVKKTIIDKKIDLTGLVLNAGMLEVGSAVSFTEAALEKMMMVNFYSHVFLVRALLPKMLRKGGSLVAISSSAAENYSEGRAIYNASKRALEGYLITVGREVGSRNVRVNIIRPGLTDTSLMRSTTSSESESKFFESAALKKVCTPDDIAQVVKFLLSAESSNMTCSFIPVHGGSRI